MILRYSGKNVYVMGILTPNPQNDLLSNQLLLFN
jgi:hypothetical protein